MLLAIAGAPAQARAPGSSGNSSPPAQTEESQRGLRTREFLGLGRQPDPKLAGDGEKIFRPTWPKILQRGIKDMVRISDARMSGTAYGTVILHVAPEAAVGGPLTLVRDGDMIEVDVEARKIHLDVSEEDLAARRSQWKKAEPAMQGGYQQLYVDHVMQAFDFLLGCRGAAVPRESH
jgi:hypothetical protein